jgi:hypothetical protein
MKSSVSHYFLLILIAMVTAACDTSSTKQTPANAKGETPVRFIICDIGDVGCKVFARFDSLGSCEVHKAFSSSLCDFDTDPQKISCKKLSERESSVVTYCLL